jgi:hypothetical protein
MGHLKTATVIPVRVYPKAEILQARIEAVQATREAYHAAVEALRRTLRELDGHHD